MTDESYSRLKESKHTKGATLVGIHTYDLLANILYSDAF